MAIYDTRFASLLLLSSLLFYGCINAPDLSISLFYFFLAGLCEIGGDGSVAIVSHNGVITAVKAERMNIIVAAKGTSDLDI